MRPVSRGQYPQRLRTSPPRLPHRRRRAASNVAAPSNDVNTTAWLGLGIDTRVTGSTKSITSTARTDVAIEARAIGSKSTTSTARTDIGIRTPAIAAKNTTSTARTDLGVVGVTRQQALYPFPKSISGNKILDQYGNVYAAKTFSSWKLANKLSDANITIALEDAVENHFNGVTVWCGGIEDRAAEGDQYTNQAGNPFWATTAGGTTPDTPWDWAGGTRLGAAWSSVDWIVSECDRLELTLHFSFCSGFGTEGAGPDWDAVTNGSMTSVGEALATRYAAYDNIVWHVMYDENPTATRISRTNALFTGINNIEGTTKRPVRWTEVGNGSTTDDVGLYDPTGATHASRFSINSWYDYDGDSVVIAEATRTQTGTGVIADCEPRYAGNGYPTGDSRQQTRERNYTTFFEGGMLINYGDECWWPFGGAPLVGGCTNWQGVVADAYTIEAGYAWLFIDDHLLDTGFEAVSTFVTTGEGTTDTKAAQGASGTVAVAYFPNSRTVQVDTTILTGTTNVRLRWYNPTSGTYTTIVASEAQQTNRAVTYPSASGTHNGSTNDWVLIADLVVGDVNTTAWLGIGLWPAAIGAKNTTSTGRTDVGIDERVTGSTKSLTSTAHLAVGVEGRAIAAKSTTSTGHLAVGVEGRSLASKAITSIARSDIGVFVGAVASKTVSLVARLYAGITGRNTGAAQPSINVCFEVGAPQFIDRSAALTMVDRSLGDPAMVDRSAGAPEMNQRDAGLAMVERTADVAFRDRSVTAEMVDRTATVEMVDREPGEPRIECEE